MNLADMIALTKIPDPIKALPEFNGGTKNLHYWITSVDEVLAVFEPIRAANAQLFQMWIGVIRAKIKNEANEALNSRGVPNDWARIKENLIEIYADNRDLATLTQQIPYLKQKDKSIEEFYSQVADLTSDINQKLSLDERYTNHVNAVMTFVRDMTKNAFIDGLKYPYNLTVRSARPATIEAAKSAAIDQLQSMNRNRFFSQTVPSSSSSEKNPQQAQARNPQKYSNQGKFRPRTEAANNLQQNFRQSANQSLFQNKNFGEQNRQTTPQNTQANFQPAFTNSQNFAPNSNVTPMEIDQSARSRFQNSQRSRNNFITNVEQPEVNEEPESVENEEDIFSDEVNFHMGENANSIT